MLHRFVLVVCLFGLVVESQQASDWHRIFEQDNQASSLEPNESHELLKQLAQNVPGEKGAPNKEQLDELVEFCSVSDDKCRAGYLRDLGIKAKYHAFTKQWSLNRYLEKCRQDQERLCTRDIDVTVEQALESLPSDKLELIELMFDKLRGQQFAKGSLAFASASRHEYQVVFTLCSQLVDLLAAPLARYRWLKDEGLHQLMSSKQGAAERWLTNGERCQYLLANRRELTGQVHKYQERLRSQGRFADSKPAQRV